MPYFHLHLSGIVQGVGMRPAIWRLATGMGLKGEVCNAPDGVHLRFEAANEQQAKAVETEVLNNLPPLARVSAVHLFPEAPVAPFEGFRITESLHGQVHALLPAPDAALCPDCRHELHDPTNRRYRYPFITCTNCGPRQTIAVSLPFDRETTTLRDFGLCPTCAAEYANPGDRRFHAQTLSCPECAIRLKAENREEKEEEREKKREERRQKAEDRQQPVADVTLSHSPEREAVEGSPLDVTKRDIGCQHPEAIIALAVEALSAGKTIAVKGLGGYLLMCDATQAEAVTTLRRRKHRPTKPLAVMYPSLELLMADLGVEYHTHHSFLGANLVGVLRTPRAHPYPTLPRGRAKPLRGFLRLFDAVLPQICGRKAPKGALRRGTPSLGKGPGVGVNLLFNELTTATAPIVLIPMPLQPASGLSVETVAPGLDEVGVMLPCAPLLELIARDFGKPVVATSANFSGSPIVFRDEDARELLRDLADLIVSHNRPITTPMDDSVVRFTADGQRIILRRGRGMVPAGPQLPQGGSPMLAFGADMKAAFGWYDGEQTYHSQYLGDLSRYEAQEHYQHALAHSLRLAQSVEGLTPCAHPYPQPSFESLTTSSSPKEGGFVRPLDAVPSQICGVYSPEKGIHGGTPSLGKGPGVGVEQANCNPYTSSAEGKTSLLADLHPGYHSTQMAVQKAENEGLACVKIQHHKAHFAAVLGEHHLAGSPEPVLGVIWDGTGLGEDGQLWGGEFFVANGGTMKRAGHLPAIPVLSGDKMARDPRLSALSALSGSCYQADLWLKPLFSATEWEFYSKLRKQPHRLYTTSAGRLFDAAAALTGICPKASYEGEAALRLEAAASRIHRHAPAVAALIREWVAAHPGSPMEVLCAALEQEWPAANAAYAFHVAMVRLIAEEAAWHQIKRVAFSGGVFQNALLCSLIRQTMSVTFDLFFHTELPPNDASIPYGQMVYVAHYQVSDIAIPSHEIPERIPRS